ncbi:MAG TPA: hypothetical protein IAB27_05385 [Candidatus Coprosoma intestinipullorum]|uniref:Uncharacterized protein n=1 Tax=Candidatus Coprosoma intestinipullorum TaxID=2840752 RepID=A0A9D1D040_9FIRM|nr:hypothetical protein [Candidatus Coprosoma intestinipullorum]
MNKTERMKEIKDLVKESKNVIVSTDKGLCFMGNYVDILILFALTVKGLKENYPKELVKFSFEMGLNDDSDDNDKSIQSSDDLIEFLERLLDDDDDE